MDAATEKRVNELADSALKWITKDPAAVRSESFRVLSLLADEKDAVIARLKAQLAGAEQALDAAVQEERRKHLKTCAELTALEGKYKALRTKKSG